MSYICPLCNGLWVDHRQCPTCQKEMSDAGRYIDLFDDYSPYLEIEGMEKLNGVRSDARNKECLHVFSCSVCGERYLRGIKEIEEF